MQERLDTESARQAELSDNAKKISEPANTIKIRIQQVIEIVQPVVDTEQAKGSEIFLSGIKHLNDWTNKLNRLIDALDKPIENYTQENFADADVDIIQKFRSMIFNG